MASRGGMYLNAHSQICLLCPPPSPSVNTYHTVASPSHERVLENIKNIQTDILMPISDAGSKKKT